MQNLSNPDSKAQIFTHFAQFIRLSPSLKDELAQRISIVHFNKGALVLRCIAVNHFSNKDIDKIVM